MGKILKNVARELSFGFWPALAMALLGGILEFGAILGFVKGDVGYEFWGFACLYMATFVLTVLNILKLIAAWLGTYEIINVESALVALVWVVLLLCIWHYPSAFEHWHALSNK